MVYGKQFVAYNVEIAFHNCVLSFELCFAIRWL